MVLNCSCSCRYLQYLMLQKNVADTTMWLWKHKNLDIAAEIAVADHNLKPRTQKLISIQDQTDPHITQLLLEMLVFFPNSMNINKK